MYEWALTHNNGLKVKSSIVRVINIRFQFVFGHSKENPPKGDKFSRVRILLAFI